MKKKHSPASKPALTQEYKVLHHVAKILQTADSIHNMLQKALQTITEFQELKVEQKAGLFLADSQKKVLRLFTTIGDFSQEFLEKEKEVPFGSCLCDRAAESGKLLISDSCFSDSRHERTFTDMTAHGHYIVPLKSQNDLVGVLFLYTDTHPTWYDLSQDVLLSIGNLIADAIKRRQVEEELNRYRNQLENLVELRTADLAQSNEKLNDEIQEHRKTHAHLLNSQNQLRKLSRQIQSAREEEKSRIAREVHDELGQSLTAFKMGLQHLEKKWPTENSEPKKQIQSMTFLIDSTIKSVQRIAMELRPPILDAFGVCEAIAWQAGEYEKRTGIKFNLHCLQEHIPIAQDIKTALFRIFQETVTNVFRHANADRIEVSLHEENKILVLEIQDNGNGIPQEKIDHPESLGLLSIRERAFTLNGKAEIKSFPGKGTRITVKIPGRES